MSNASSCLTGNNRLLVCFHQNEELVYKDPDSDYCWTTANEDIVETELKIVPNPALNEINILSEDQILEAGIYDISGNLIKVSKSRRIDISAFEPGIYLVKAKTNGKLIIGKFVKM